MRVRRVRWAHKGWRVPSRTHDSNMRSAFPTLDPLILHLQPSTLTPSGGGLGGAERAGAGAPVLRQRRRRPPHSHPRVARRPGIALHRRRCRERPRPVTAHVCVRWHARVLPEPRCGRPREQRGARSLCSRPCGQRGDHCCSALPRPHGTAPTVLAGRAGRLQRRAAERPEPRQRHLRCARTCQQLRVLSERAASSQALAQVGSAASALCTRPSSRSSQSPTLVTTTPPLGFRPPTATSRPTASSAG